MDVVTYTGASLGTRFRCDPARKYQVTLPTVGTCPNTLPFENGRALDLESDSFPVIVGAK